MSTDSIKRGIEKAVAPDTLKTDCAEFIEDSFNASNSQERRSLYTVKLSANSHYLLVLHNVRNNHLLPALDTLRRAPAD